MRPTLWFDGEPDLALRFRALFSRQPERVSFLRRLVELVRR